MNEWSLKCERKRKRKDKAEVIHVPELVAFLGKDRENKSTTQVPQAGVQSPSSPPAQGT